MSCCDQKNGCGEKHHLPVLEVEAEPEPELSGIEVEGMERLQSTRRDFLRQVGVAAGVTAAASATGCSSTTWEEYFHQHYKRLSDEDKAQLFALLEQRTHEKYGVEVHIRDPQPIEGVEFAYALNLSICTGCRQCEYACAKENNTSLDPEMHYIRVLELDKGTMDVDRSNHFYEGEVPKPDKYYMPVQCHQCANPPCVDACPVQATWREPDGIVVVDYDWCIGCRYCEAACPYWARRFNWAEPSIRPSDINPEQGYLSNRIRPKGVMEKCTFCVQRIRSAQQLSHIDGAPIEDGTLQTACQQACPSDAIVFGDLNDRQSAVAKSKQSPRNYGVLAELATKPRLTYLARLRNPHPTLVDTRFDVPEAGAPTEVHAEPAA